MAMSVLSLLRAGVFGDGLSALRDGMLGELSGQKEPHSSLNLPGGDGGPLVVVGKPASLGSNPLKQIIDKGVHDAHGLGGDTSVRVHLLQHLIDVDGIGLLPLPFPLLLVSLSNRLGGLARLGSSLTGGLGRHDDSLSCSVELMPVSVLDHIFIPSEQLAGIVMGRPPSFSIPLCLNPAFDPDEWYK